MSVHEFQDLLVHTNKRCVAVVTEWSAPQQQWYVHIRDDSQSGLHKGQNFGGWVVGESAQWCATREEVVKARKAALLAVSR